MSLNFFFVVPPLKKMLNPKIICIFAILTGLVLSQVVSEEFLLQQKIKRQSSSVGPAIPAVQIPGQNQQCYVLMRVAFCFEEKNWTNSSSFSCFCCNSREVANFCCFFLATSFLCFARQLFFSFFFAFSIKIFFLLGFVFPLSDNQIISKQDSIFWDMASTSAMNVQLMLFVFQCWT